MQLIRQRFNKMLWSCKVKIAIDVEKIGPHRPGDLACARDHIVMLNQFIFELVQCF